MSRRVLIVKLYVVI